MYYNSYGSASLLIKKLLDPEELIEYCVCVAPLPGPSLFGGLDDGQTQSTQPEHGHCRTRLHLSKCTIPMLVTRQKTKNYQCFGSGLRFFAGSGFN